MGYPHVGYNVGGIVGRQDGLVTNCVNRGFVQGRKDVGGIVGQMIPDITIQAGPDRVAQLRTELSTLAELTERTNNDLTDASDTVTTRVGNINNYANSAESTVKGLMDDLNSDMTYDDLKAWLDKVNESADSIHGYLTGINGEMDALVKGISNASASLSSDLRAVSGQLNTTMDLFLTLIDEVTDTSSAVVQDVSENTLYSAKRGKAADCINHGAVEGDRNVGGIAGALAIEYDYDREDDLFPAGSRTVKYTYLTRAILLDCQNYGAVTAKKSCAGGVAGRMDLGTVYGCGGWGAVSIESGDYAGGVAGLSLTSVRRSYAKCTLSGSRYIGGVVGSGCNVTDCIAMPKVTAATQLSGGIAGEITGAYSGNLFVSDSLAGVDRVSYQDKAEPISYRQLLARTDIPDDFRTLTLTFVADGKTLRTLTFPYGASFNVSFYPQVPAKDGCYVRWDIPTLDHLTFDTVVTAVYEPYITTLSWATSRDGRAVLLVEGQFCEGDRLRVIGASVPKELAGEGVGSYHLTIPEGTSRTHTIRWLLPEDAPRRMTVYVNSGSGWQRVSHQVSGSYLCFQMSDSGQFAVVRDESIPVRVWVISGIAAALTLCAVLGIHQLRKKRKNKSQA